MLQVLGPGAVKNGSSAKIRGRGGKLHFALIPAIKIFTERNNKKI